jgi:hypothetical protein
MFFSELKFGMQSIGGIDNKLMLKVLAKSIKLF